MPFNAQGAFQRLFNWKNDRDAGVKILADRMDQEMDGIAAAINDVTGGEVGFRAPVRSVSGTASAPAHSFSGHPGTGAYRGSDGAYAVAVDGVDVLRLLDGQAAGAAVQESPLDSDPGKLLTAGAFGWGETGNPPAVVDVDATDTATGLYRWGSTTPNAASLPGAISGAYGYMLLTRRGGDLITQEVWRFDGAGGRYIRYFSGVWSSWVRVYDSRNVVGSVSVVDGIPTGAIIERGSNANGDFVRFADGTQICGTTVTTASGGEVARVWPAQFIGAPNLSAVASAPNTPITVTLSNIGANSVNVSTWGAASSRVDGFCNIVSIGRWD